MLVTINMKVLRLVTFIVFPLGMVDCYSYQASQEELNCSKITKFEAEDRISKVRLVYYPGIALADNISIPINQSMDILQNQRFDKNKCLVLYILSFNSPSDDRLTRNLLKAYVEQEKYNVLFLDWSDITVNDLYSDAVAIGTYLAQDIAVTLDEFLDQGVPLCHITGHSLGGQLAGTVARGMRHRVSHLIVLEPAFPLYYPPMICSEAISENDANCVEVIRTDAGGGFSVPTNIRVGKNEYFVNGGVHIQPNCIETRIPFPGGPTKYTACSHNRAIAIRTDSLRDPQSLIGVNCTSWADFMNGTCRGNPTNIIGSCFPNSPPGSYYMQTNSQEPYGRGDAGIQPEAD